MLHGKLHLPISMPTAKIRRAQSSNGACCELWFPAYILIDEIYVELSIKSGGVFPIWFSWCLLLFSFNCSFFASEFRNDSTKFKSNLSTWSNCWLITTFCYTGAGSTLEYSVSNVYVNVIWSLETWLTFFYMLCGCLMFLKSSYQTKVRALFGYL